MRGGLDAPWFPCHFCTNVHFGTVFAHFVCMDVGVYMGMDVYMDMDMYMDVGMV